MVKIKEEKGAITLLVIITVIFFVSFLTATYVYISNKSATQMEATSQIREIYANEDANEIYSSFFENNEQSQIVEIPIYTKEQLLAMGTNQYKQINEIGGKYYYFSENSSYILMNDIEIENDANIMDLLQNINFEFNNHKFLINGENARLQEYMNILNNLLQREIISDKSDLSIEILKKLYNITEKLNLSINCFSLVIDGNNVFIVYLYGEIYRETFTENDGTASYNARKSKIEKINKMMDVSGMLIGDANENGKIDAEDMEYIYYVAGNQYSSLKYDTNKYDTNWIDTYYLIISDINNDGKCDGSDVSVINEYLNNLGTTKDFIKNYDINNSTNEEKIITYNY